MDLFEKFIEKYAGPFQVPGGGRSAQDPRQGLTVNFTTEVINIVEDMNLSDQQKVTEIQKMIKHLRNRSCQYV